MEGTAEPLFREDNLAEVLSAPRVVDVKVVERINDREGGHQKDVSGNDETEEEFESWFVFDGGCW